MSENLQDRLIAGFTAVLDTHTQALPSAIPLAVPVRKLAQAAMDVLALGRGVPMIPVYDHELAVRRSWHGARSAAELEESLGFPHLEAVEDGEAVLFTATGADGARVEVRLPPNDAEEFSLHTLSAVEAARARAQSAQTDAEVFRNFTSVKPT